MKREIVIRQFVYYYVDTDFDDLEYAKEFALSNFADYEPNYDSPEVIDWTEIEED